MALPPIKDGNASLGRTLAWVVWPVLELTRFKRWSIVKMQSLPSLRFSLVWACAAMALSAVSPATAWSLEFKTVAVTKAILYDAPSAQGKKLYILGLGYPVEVIVNLGEWVKVRDNQGGLSWIEAKQLGNVRGVLVAQGPTDLRQAADASSALLAKLDKDVVLDVIEVTKNETMKNGWLKVKHRDGITGYVQANAVWGW